MRFTIPRMFHPLSPPTRPHPVPGLRARPAFRHTATLLLTLVAVTSLRAQPFLPSDVGATVNGYQDDFSGGALGADWAVRGADVVSVSGGLLHVSSASGDPNHLLYERAGYDATVQEVLARIRILQFSTGDPCRAGLGVAVDPGSSQGVNYHFRDVDGEGQTGRHLSFLDDLRAWGPGQGFTWQNNLWYWLRLRHDPDAASQGGNDDVFGKIWLGDGSEPEPADWQLRWDYTSFLSVRSGFAGITLGSADGLSVFDVDYVLIKAAGLPAILPAPEAFVQIPAAITSQPTDQSVLESSAATFQVTATGNPLPTFQWYREAAPIPGATRAVYTLDPVAMTDDGARFHVVAANLVTGVVHSVTSVVATLTVQADTTPPVLLGARALGLGQVQLWLSERVTAPSANDATHFALSGPGGAVTVSQAVLDSTQTNIVLHVGALTENASYVLTVNDVVDTSAAANRIAANSQVSFTASSYALENIGNPSPGGTATFVANGMDLTGGGATLSGTSDQSVFSYLQRTGDFDVRVRVESLGLSHPWAEAGLMARETPAADSRYAAALTTPSINGSFFRNRSAAGAAATVSGSFPVNYPATWLRLRREGNVFTGYAGTDGLAWTPLGSVTLAVPSTIHLGFVVVSRVAGQSTTARFREYGDVTTVVERSGWPATEPLGQSSRRTSLVVSEISYHPPDVPLGGRAAELEFIELFNSRDEAEDLSGYRLAGSIDYTFPPGTVLPGGGFLVVARAPLDLQTVYGITGALGPWELAASNGLPNDAGTVRLRHWSGGILLEVDYTDDPPWPVAADGLGHTLVLTRPSFGEGDPRAWAASDTILGSPGRMDAVTEDPLRAVIFNEVLAHTAEDTLDFVELFNRGATDLDLSGCFLSDDASLLKYRFPTNTMIPARGRLVRTESELGFALDATGETVHLRNAANTRVLDALRFPPQRLLRSWGRFPDGAPRWQELGAPTSGTANRSPTTPDVVINELYYDPISGNDDDQFIELHNPGASTVDLGGWQFTEGVQFVFPSSTLLSGGGYLVVVRNATRFLTNHPAVDPAKVLGNFTGQLAHGGERVVLTRPEPWLTTNEFGWPWTNTLAVVADRVAYETGGRWPVWAHGGGSSLERVHPGADPDAPACWAASEESGKAPWTLVSHRGVLDHGTVAANQLQVLLLGAGECLIDNVEVLDGNNVNRVANSTFESNASGWTAEGTEAGSGWESSEGYNSARSYHVRAIDRGDNQINRIRTPLTTSLAAGSTVTIQARVRWLRGHPELLFRLRGNWLETAATLVPPTNPGTPTAPNTRNLSQAPPALVDIAHAPALPDAGQPVVVTARLLNPQRPATLRLHYRIDPSATVATLTMRDDGTSGDATAGDGVYSATIPGQTADTLVAFHLEAATTSGPAITVQFPSDAPTRECLVRFGEATPTGSIPIYRFWMTQATFNAWDGRPNLDNRPNDVTFVLGRQRVIYNAEALFAGSPYIAPGFNTPSGNRCGYSVNLPADDRFLGSRALVLDWPGGHGNENTAVQEQMAWWIADRLGLPYSHRHFIRLHVNGVTDLQRGGVFEAVLQPAGDYLDQWSAGDTDGDFFKIDRAFEFSDSGSLTADPMPRLERFTTPDLTNGGTRLKIEPYRWTWLKRSYDTAHNYTNLFALVEALNAASPEPYTTDTEQLVDLEEWMGIFAFEHLINNFDSWGHIIGKNMYAYKPRQGRWQLYAFDLDWLMLVSTRFGSEYTAANGPLFNSDDPTVSRMYEHPPFRRAYYRAIEDAVNGPLVASTCDPVMDAKYASLVANGVTLCDGAALAAPTAVKTWFAQRRAALLNQLALVAGDFTVAGPSPRTVNTNVITLTGTAPIGLHTVLVNGIGQPLSWTTVNTWTLTLAVRHGTNQLVFTGQDHRGNPLPGITATLTVISTAPDPTPADRVLFNEWMASNTGFILDPLDQARDDWFEFFNPGPAPVPLGGYYLTDDAAVWNQFQLPAGVVVPANGYLLVWADGHPELNAPGIELHTPFQLSRDGESLALYAPDGRVIDAVTFGPQTSNRTEGRYPDGAPAALPLAVPTPRGPNSLDGSAPSPLMILELPDPATLRLTWSTVAGRRYEVQSTDDLSAPTWVSAAAAQFATGSALTLDLAPEPEGQRFYRIVISP